MSQITSIYDALQTRIAAALTGYKRLSNPYKVEENPTILLKAGYGVQILSGDNSNDMLSLQLGITRDFRVVLTREYFALENDPASKATAEKQLMEDQFTVIKDFEKNTTLSGTASQTNFQSDGGLTYVSKDRDNFLTIETVFRVRYFENLIP